MDTQWGNQHWWTTQSHCLSVRLFYLRSLCCPPMLIIPVFVRSSFLLKVIVLSTNVDYPIVCHNTITLSKKDERTNTGIINIGGQHSNLK
jgi:hypothetical protein